MEKKLATRDQEKEVLAWIVRKFPEGQVPAKWAQYLIEHTDEIPALLLAMLGHKIGAFPSLTLAADLIPKGWEVLEDVVPSDFDVSKLKPIRVLKGNESYVNSDEMRKRAKELGCNWGLVDGKKVLVEQDRIPVEFRKYYIPLPGTLLRDSDRNLHVPFLFWHGGVWVLSFRWQGIVWYDSARFARSE